MFRATAAAATALLAAVIHTPSTIAQSAPRVSIAYPEISTPLALGTPAEPAERDHAIGINPFLALPSLEPDRALQTFVPFASMPSTGLNFTGQGTTNSPSTRTGAPSDANGAAGANHYVQIVNGGVMIWNKEGTVVQASRVLNALWSGYVGTNPGNGCATRNDGDGIVLYDQLADRWFITQFSLPNFGNNVGPAFQCIAVSKTGDPTGAYSLYDFQYSATVNDYAKFGIWPDAYYASFNNYGASFIGANACAYDRAKMLSGLPATQVCLQQGSNVFGLLPVSLDGKIGPPAGTPGFFLNLRDSTSLGLYQFHVDFVNPGSSTFTGPAVITVNAYSQLCTAALACVPQAAPGGALASLGDRLMFRATYRNFGTHESLLATHSVSANSAGGMRWYEIRSPRTAPAIFQQGTYSPNDGHYRWMGSIAEDQAQDFALGFSISSSITKPGIAWTGRTPADPTGTMGQGEVVIKTGTGVETSGGINRWGDYTNMTVDPADDCTFWYTNQYYVSNGLATWDTQIATVKFDNCGKNDFSLSVTPSSQSIVPGSTAFYSVSSGLTAGTAETITLNVQDLPPGVTASWSPASITAGSGSTLVLTADAAATPAGPVTFTVIGKADSGLHAASASGAVVAPLLVTPGHVAANAVSSTEVTLSWDAVIAATTYRIVRRSPAGLEFAGTASTNSFTDTNAAPDTAYLYKVHALGAAGESADSAADLATTTIFDDDPLLSDSTAVRAVHLAQVRTAISAVAALAATGPLTFTDPSPGSVGIQSVHVTELRTALDAARSALLLPGLSYGNTAAKNTPVTAADFTELRNGVK